MNWLCYHWGHKWKGGRSWQAEMSCSRCGISEYMSEYYPSLDLGSKLAVLVNTPKWKLARLWFTVKTTLRPKICEECGKVEYVAGKEVGDHSDCHIPF